MYLTAYYKSTIFLFSCYMEWINLKLFKYLCCCLSVPRLRSWYEFDVPFKFLGVADPHIWYRYGQTGILHFELRVFKYLSKMKCVIAEG